MVKPGHTGFKRLTKASEYSIKGFAAAWRNESAFRQECALGAVMFPLAFWLGENLAQVLLLVGVCAIVLITELLNSAIEAVVDRIGSEHHELAGRAKDLGSAAVAISLMLVLVTWSLIAWTRFTG